MKFSKWYQPKNGRGGRKSAQHCTRQQTAAEIMAERERQLKAFNDFTNAESGYFSGFDFVDIFYEKIKKEDAIYIGEADDSANVTTPFGDFETGADNVTAYFFSKQPKKIVRFNRSIYFF